MSRPSGGELKSLATPKATVYSVHAYTWSTRENDFMGRVFSAQNSGVVQSIFRIVVGFLFACHGAASLFGILGGADGVSGAAVPFGVWPYWWAAVIEFVGGILVALGLLTRVAAI